MNLSEAFQIDAFKTSKHVKEKWTKKENVHEVQQYVYNQPPIFVQQNYYRHYLIILSKQFSFLFCYRSAINFRFRSY